MAQAGWPWLPWMWTLQAATEAGRAAGRQLSAFLASEEGPVPAPPDFASPHAVVGETRLLRLVDFPGPGPEPRTLLITPYALHGPVVADLAPGHSIVEALLGAGLPSLRLLAWRSAGPDMAEVGIDDHLAALNVVVDDMGGRVALAGLCQGGWLALAYAARFPAKVERLALAGSPVDLAATPSGLVEAARGAAPGALDGVLAVGGGVVRGGQLRALWDTAGLTPEEVSRLLGVAAADAELLARFAAWDAVSLDLPGRYWREMTERVFRDNALAEGRMDLLGRRVALSDVRCPLFLLAGRDDPVAPPAQVLAAARHVGTQGGAVKTAVAPCGHLGLFLAAPVLRGAWPRIGRFLAGAVSGSPAPGSARFPRGSRSRSPGRPASRARRGA